ncbi:MAG TPA: P-loop NTPase [Gammaproteobacteria bacterium]
MELNTQTTGTSRFLPIQVIAVTGGKGGIGKTNVSINLAVALSNRGRSVMLLDANLGMANVDVMLGLQCQYNLSHLLNGERDLDEIIVKGPSDILVVPAASGVQRMVKLSAAEHTGLIHAFSEVSERMNTLIIDTAAGIIDSVISFTRAAHEVIVVVCDEPASIADASALIRVLCKEHDVSRFRVLTNMVESFSQGKKAYEKLLGTVSNALDVTLEYIGFIPFDEHLRKAVQRRRAVVNAFPESASATAFTDLAATVDHWPVVQTSEGRLEFFFERLVKA